METKMILRNINSGHFMKVTEAGNTVWTPVRENATKVESKKAYKIARKLACFVELCK